MNIFLNIKLIARNWWRNKLFFLISLFSLTAGLGCTNLLMTFFIHEYNVEKYNTDRNLIVITMSETLGYIFPQTVYPYHDLRLIMNFR